MTDPAVLASVAAALLASDETSSTDSTSPPESDSSPLFYIRFIILRK
jgi:hypothetical protein